MVLRGLAMQSHTKKELANRMGISEKSLRNWCTQSPEIAEAVHILLEDADALVLAKTFERVKYDDKAAINTWWRFRLCEVKQQAPANPAFEVINTMFREGDLG